MKMDTLQDVYHDQLQDLHSACAQSLDATTKLGRAASNKELSEALISGAQGISDGLDTLKSLCAQNDISQTGSIAKAWKGLSLKQMRMCWTPNLVTVTCVTP